MVDALVNEDKGLVVGGPSVLVDANGVDAGLAPGVMGAVNKSEAGVGKREAAVAVDALGVGGGGDAEGLLAPQGRIFEVDEAGHERQLAAGHAGAGDEVAPLCAGLVGPGPEHALRD